MLCQYKSWIAQCPNEGTESVGLVPFYVCQKHTSWVHPSYMRRWWFFVSIVLIDISIAIILSAILIRSLYQ